MLCIKCKSSDLRCLKIYINYPIGAKKYICKNCDLMFILKKEEEEKEEKEKEEKEKEEKEEEEEKEEKEEKDEEKETLFFI